MKQNQPAKQDVDKLFQPIIESRPRAPFRTLYTETSRAQDLSAFEPSRTQQQFKEECDINRIVTQSMKNGLSPFREPDPRLYADFSEPQDLQESMHVVNHAKQQFASLPSKVRERFGNSPEKFLAFVGDPENVREMVKLGLMNPEAVERVKKEKEARKAARDERAKKPDPVPKKKASESSDSED